MTQRSTVGDLMSTALVFVRDTDTLAIAQRKMLRAGIHHLPVVDEHQNLIGIISRTDLAERRHRASRTQRIGKFMSRSVVTVTPETSLALAEDLMLENGFRSLPVVANDGHLMGILTETDLLRRSRAVDPLSSGRGKGGSA